MIEIKAEHVLLFMDGELRETNLHLACLNGDENPLDVYLQGWDRWIAWNEAKIANDNFDRKYVLSLIQLADEPHRWLFGGFFLVKNRFDDPDKTEVGHQLSLLMHHELIGRLIIEFHPPEGKQGSRLSLEDHFNDFVVSEIIREPLGHGIHLD